LSAPLLGDAVCGLDVVGLGGLVPAAQQQDQSLAFLEVVHPVAGAVVDADFADSGADRLDVSGVPGRQSGEADEDMGRGVCLSVFVNHRSNVVDLTTSTMCHL